MIHNTKAEGTQEPSKKYLMIWLPFLTEILIQKTQRTVNLEQQIETTVPSTKQTQTHNYIFTLRNESFLKISY